MKEKEESPGKQLNETEASKLSDIKFKIIVIRMIKELIEYYKELQRSYKELTASYSSIKKDIETINNSQEKMKNTLPEMHNRGEGIKIGVEESEDQINELEDKV